MATLVEEEVKATSTLASTKLSPVDLDTDDGVAHFDDENVTARPGLQKIMPADKNGAVVRCTLLVDVTPARMKWLHFVQVGERKQVVRCLSKRDKKHNIITEGICCQKLKNSNDQRAQLNFAVLAMKYKNADPATGKYKAVLNEATGQKEAPPILWELGWVKLSQPGFQKIADLRFENEEKPLFDIGIKYKTGGNGFEYNRLTDGKALFRKSDEFMAEVMEEAKKFANGEFLLSQLGRAVTELDMRAILSGSSATSGGQGGHSSQIDNTDDL